MQPMNMPKMPTVKELWKNEKSKYRVWIITLGLGLVAIIALMLTSVIFNQLNKSTIVDELFKYYEKDYKVDKAHSLADKGFIQSYLVFPSLQLLAVTIGLVLFISGTYNSYKSKNFGKLSSWPTFIVGLGALLAFVNIIMGFFGGRSSARFATPGGILQFIVQILFLVIYGAASSPVSRLRRQFLMAERMEKLQSNPQYQQMMNQFGGAMNGGQPNVGPFGPMAGMNPNPQQGTAQQQPNGTVTPAAPVEDPEVKRLKSLSLTQLKNVAKKLSISGYENMNKDELIKAILTVTNNNK